METLSTNFNAKSLKILKKTTYIYTHPGGHTEGGPGISPLPPENFNMYI